MDNSKYKQSDIHRLEYQRQIKQAEVDKANAELNLVEFDLANAQSLLNEQIDEPVQQSLASVEDGTTNSFELEKEKVDSPSPYITAESLVSDDVELFDNLINETKEQTPHINEEVGKTQMLDLDFTNLANEKPTQTEKQNNNLGNYLASKGLK